MSRLRNIIKLKNPTQELKLRLPFTALTIGSWINISSSIWADLPINKILTMIPNNLSRVLIYVEIKLFQTVF